MKYAIIGDEGITFLQATLGQADADGLHQRSVESRAELGLEVGIGLGHQLLQAGSAAGGDEVQADLTFFVGGAISDGLADDALHEGGVGRLEVDAEDVGLVERVLFHEGSVRLGLDEILQLRAEGLGLGGLGQREGVGVHSTIVGHNQVHGRVHIRNAECDGSGDEGNCELHGCKIT